MTDEEIAFYDIIMAGREYLENDTVARKIAIDVVDYLKKNLTINMFCLLQKMVME